VTTPIQGSIRSTALEKAYDTCNGNAHVLARRRRGPFHRALHRLDKLGGLDLFEPPICSVECLLKAPQELLGIAPSRLALHTGSLSTWNTVISCACP
jgi:hypothetical protein